MILLIDNYDSFSYISISANSQMRSKSSGMMR